MSKQKKTEWTVKELSDNKAFPYHSRMIREFIKQGRLNVIACDFKTIKIPQSSVDEFMEKYKENKKNQKSDK